MIEALPHPGKDQQITVKSGDQPDGMTRPGGATEIRTKMAEVSSFFARPGADQGV